jgi:MoaA/NifB/PqqE/SkfB family radical SAM enzyme
VRAAQRITARGRIKLRINTVVSSRTIRGLSGMRELVRGLGPDVSWKLIPVDPVDAALLPSLKAIERAAAEVSRWDELEDRAPFGRHSDQYSEAAAGRYGFRGAPCFAPWFHLFFTPDGGCYPCCMTRGSIASLGRFPGQSVREILEGAPMCRLRSLMASGERLASCACCDDFLVEGEAITRLLAPVDRS